MGRGIPFSLELHDYACGRLMWTHVEEAYTYKWLMASTRYLILSVELLSTIRLYGPDPPSTTHDTSPATLQYSLH